MAAGMDEAEYIRNYGYDPRDFRALIGNVDKKKKYDVNTRINPIARQLHHQLQQWDFKKHPNGYENMFENYNIMRGQGMAKFIASEADHMTDEQLIKLNKYLQFLNDAGSQASENTNLPNKGMFVE